MIKPVDKSDAVWKGTRGNVHAQHAPAAIASRHCRTRGANQFTRPLNHESITQVTLLHLQLLQSRLARSCRQSGTKSQRGVQDACLSLNDVQFRFRITL